jgi:hypothetical protein
VTSASLIALAAFGLEALHRKTEREFPGAMRGDSIQAMRQLARRATTESGRRMSSAINGHGHDDRHPDDARLDRLERLGELEEHGVLTEAEFREEKQRILTSGLVAPTGVDQSHAEGEKPDEQ